jgi:DNA repair protein RecN (Recombination protein N)
VVTAEERIVEIARMLGGDADREVSRAHARELLQRGSVDEPTEASVLPAVASERARATRKTRGKAAPDRAS